MRRNKLIKAGVLLGAVMMAISSIGLQTLAESPYYKTVYVDASASGAGNGTKDKPFKTIQEAKAYVRTINQNMTGDIFVDIAPGEYFEGTLDFDEVDSGYNGYDVIYGSSSDERPLITGGKHVPSRWTLADAEKNIYSTSYAGVDYMRQIYVNDQRAELAKGGWYEYVNKDVSEKTTTGYITEDTRMHEWRNITDVEFVYAELWTSGRCRVAATELLSDGRMEIKMHSAMWRELSVVKSNGRATFPWYVQNAYELLDEPGEFYYDRVEKKIYYMPREGEDMATAEVIVPHTVDLLTIEGTKENKITHIRFEGLEFSHSAWYRVDELGGWTDSQNNIYYADPEVPWLPSALTVNFATHIDFVDCKIEHIGQTGLNMVHGVNSCDIIGNEFNDLAAGAISIGTANQGEPYNGDAREDTYNITFSNNWAHDVSKMYHASAIVTIGLLSDSSFTHNDVGNGSYTGFHTHYGWEGNITLGTGFTNVHVDDNYIYNTMHGTPINDGAAVYTMGSTGGQHGNYNTVSRNYIRQSGITNGAGGIYNDQGSSYWDQRDNVIDFYDSTMGPVAAQLLWSNTWNTQQSFVNFYDTYTTENCNGIYDVGIESDEYNTTFVRERQWDDKAKATIRNSGLEPEYRARLGGGKTEGFETIVLFNGEEKFINNGDFESRTFKLEVGESRTLSYEGQNTYGEVVPESEYSVEFKSLTPGIISVSGKTVTARGIGEGILEITTTYDGGKKQVREVSVMCGDNLKTVKWNDVTEKMLLDATMSTALTCTTEFGSVLKADDYDVYYYSTDPEIATVDQKGVITAKAEGTVEIVAAVTHDGHTVEGRRTMLCEPLRKFDTTGLKVTDITPIIQNTSKWYIIGAGNAASSAENTVTVSTPGGYAMYMDQAYENELLNFNALVTGPDDGWPTIVFGQKEPTANPIGNAQHSYIICVKPTEIELQKFVNGARTMFYGVYGGNQGIYGIKPNTYIQYGKSYNIQIGAITQDDGNVRLIMNVDGYNVFDCLDTSDTKITGPVYFGCINQGTGGIWTFSPPVEAGFAAGDTAGGGFDDIAGHWARADINKLFAKGYVSGVTETTFAPNTAITKAEFTAILTRIMEAVAEDGYTGLADVKENAWYAKSVAGALGAGLIDSNLVKNDCFNPNAYITREEMASMMVLAYANFFDDYPEDADISGFADASAVEAWAYPYLENAVGGGLMYGDDANRLNPSANATRAEAAAMLSRFVKIIE